MPTEPENLFIQVETTRGLVLRSIKVKPDPEVDVYRVHMVDVISRNTQNHVLLSRLSEEATGVVTGVCKTLEEANAEARAIYQRYLDNGWEEETPQTRN